MPEPTSTEGLVYGETPEAARQYLRDAWQHVRNQTPPPGYRQIPHIPGRAPIGDPAKPVLQDASYKYHGRSIISVSYPESKPQHETLQFGPDGVKIAPGFSGLSIADSLNRFLRSHGVRLKAADTKLGHDPNTKTNYVEFDVDPADFEKAQKLISEYVHDGVPTAPGFVGKVAAIARSSLGALSRVKSIATKFAGAAGIGAMMLTIGTVIAHAATPGDTERSEADVKALADMTVNSPVGAVGAFATAVIAEPIRQVSRMLGVQSGPTLSETFASLTQKIGAERAGAALAAAPMASASGNLINNLTPLLGSPEYKGTRDLILSAKSFRGEINSIESGNTAALLEKAANFADKLSDGLKDKGPAGEATRKAMNEYLKKLNVSAEQYAEFLHEYATALRDGTSPPPPHQENNNQKAEPVKSEEPAVAADPKPDERAAPNSTPVARNNSRPPAKGMVPPTPDDKPAKVAAAAPFKPATAPSLHA